MNIEKARHNMIKQQFRPWGIVNERTLALLERIPREFFVPHSYQYLAFAETQIPLGHGQCMLQPREEAKIIDVLQIQENERVLEIGTGSGYFTALLATQAKHVESVDILGDFTAQAAQKLSALSMHNVVFQTVDAAVGYKGNTQYDVIVITGGLPFLPKSFKQKLTVGGRLFAFLGQGPLIEAVLITRLKENHWEKEVLFETYVAPLLNAIQPNSFTF